MINIAEHVFDGEVFTIAYYKCPPARAMPGAPNYRRPRGFKLEKARLNVRNYPISKDLNRTLGRVRSLVAGGLVV
jgi:hypothetical protein